MMVVSVLGGLLPLATAIQAQTNSFLSAVNVPAVPNALPQHVPSIRSGPIDLSKYSSDVLSCAICRERLGLPAIGTSPASASKPELVQPLASTPSQKFLSPPQQVDRPASERDLPPKVGASFGGSGLITAGAAKQLEASGLVIQEFRPPTPNPEDFRLENLPPEARQQFFRQLELPNGARVMSAQIIAATEPTLEARKEETLQPANPTKDKSVTPEPSTAEAETLQIAEQMKAENSKLAEKLAAAAKEREKLQEMMRVQAESFEKKMAEIERSNQETAKMLEARTLEVTELQNQLQAKPKSQKRSKAEPGNAKKKPSKNTNKDH
jgi:hypothetical protein